MDQTMLLALVGDLYLSDRAKALQIEALQARIAELEKDQEDDASVDK